MCKFVALYFLLVLCMKFAIAVDLVYLDAHASSVFFPFCTLPQVRYLLQGGANVVRCAALLMGSCYIAGGPIMEG